MWQKVLVPLDGSPLAEQALPYASALSYAFGTEVYLLRVCQEGEDCWPYMDKVAEQVQGRLGNLAAHLHLRVATGDPVTEILRYAGESGIDTIIMTAQGQSGRRPGTLGKLAAKLTQTTTLPLLVLQPLEKPSPRALDLFKRILVPLDGTARGAAVIPPLVALTRKVPASITLLEVLEEGHTVRTTGALDFVPYTEDRNARLVEARRYLYDASVRFYGTKAKVTVEVKAGDPTKEILRQAEAMDATLLALASHMHSALEKWFYGSVSEAVEKSVHRSFLLVPAREVPGDTTDLSFT